MATTITLYLKLLKKYSVALSTGRADFPTILFGPSDTECLKLYSDVIDTNKDSLNYNKLLFDRYISENILTIIPITTTIPITTVTIISPL